MSGGDKTLAHNGHRDTLYKQTKAGGFAPELEKGGLFREAQAGQEREDDDGRDARRRPADVLVCRAHDFRSARGRGVDGATRVALDVGIICPQAQDHIIHTLEETVGAAEEYARRKCGRQATEAKRRKRGMFFQPLIFESTGGVASETEEVVKVICRAVANKTGSSYASVAQHVWWRLSVDVQKAGHRALVRRTTAMPGEGTRALEAMAHAGEILEAPLHMV